MTHIDFELTYVPKVHYCLRGRLTLSTEVLANVYKDKRAEDLQKQINGWICCYTKDFDILVKTEGYGRIMLFATPKTTNNETPQWKIEIIQTYLQNTIIELYELDTDMCGEFKVVEKDDNL